MVIKPDLIPDLAAKLHLAFPGNAQRKQFRAAAALKVEETTIRLDPDKPASNSDRGTWVSFAEPVGATSTSRFCVRSESTICEWICQIGRAIGPTYTQNAKLVHFVLRLSYEKQDEHNQ